MQEGFGSLLRRRYQGAPPPHVENSTFCEQSPVDGCFIISRRARRLFAYPKPIRLSALSHHLSVDLHLILSSLGEASEILGHRRVLIKGHVGGVLHECGGNLHTRTHSKTRRRTHTNQPTSYNPPSGEPSSRNILAVVTRAMGGGARGAAPATAVLAWPGERLASRS